MISFSLEKQSVKNCPGKKTTFRRVLPIASGRLLVFTALLFARFMLSSSCRVLFIYRYYLFSIFTQPNSNSRIEVTEAFSK